MLAELDTYDWREAFGEEGTYNDTAKPEEQPPNCGVATNRVTRGDVAEIIAMQEGDRDGPSWVGVFRLNDGRFATVEGGCDYTGLD